MKAHTPIRVDITKEIRKLVQYFRDSTLLEAEKILTKAMVVDQALTAKDIERVIEAKKDIERDGLLGNTLSESTMGDIAALNGLKTWLRKRKKNHRRSGTGQTTWSELSQRRFTRWDSGYRQKPLRQSGRHGMDASITEDGPIGLYNKYIGETEKISEKPETANRMSPVVLWIDEIEKAFTASEGDGDGGVTYGFSALSYRGCKTEPGTCLCGGNRQ